MIGTIYKITNHNKIYVGSSINLPKRMQTHNSKFRMWKKDNTREFCTSFIILDENDDWKMEEIVSLEVNDEVELRRMEGVFIKAYKNDGCVNSVIAGRTLQEWRDDNREMLKKQAKKDGAKYREKHREKINEKRKTSSHDAEYRERNRKEINIRQRERRKLIALQNTTTP